MKLKKNIAAAMAVALSVCSMTACSGSSTADSSKDSTNTSSDSTTEDSSDANTSAGKDMFADGDFNDVTSEEENATITLDGATGTISDTTRGSSGSEVTITSKGIYRVTGSSEDVTIVVNDDNESGNIYVILDNVTMTNTSTACINVQAADKVIVQCVGDNTLTYDNTSDDAETTGAIYAKDDVTINGSGTLSITSGLHGVVCKNDLKVTGAELTVNAEKSALKANDSVRIGGGTAVLTAGKDGIHVDNDENDSFFYFEEADLTIDAENDGIDVAAGVDTTEFTGYINLNGGTIDITAGGGSDSAKNSSTSQKGVKCAGDITIADTDLKVSSADDAVHGKSDITISSGTVELSSSDDGMIAAAALRIDGGNISITKSYEGIEASTIEINDGILELVSSDDGINNTSGGTQGDTDAEDAETTSDTTSALTLTINGGTIFVHAGGDGIDSDGSFYVTGGTTVIESATTNNNGALDKGDDADCVASITGGTVLALGSTGMAKNFDTGTQCSALVAIAGSEGTEISVDDGSDFTFTATKDFACAVYSSADLKEGSSYTLQAGSASAVMDFADGLYYTDVQ